jgi:two-component system, NtrC family, sensor histidine kinase HydH
LARLDGVDKNPELAPIAEASQAGTDERQRLITRLLARLAHEIRNPLSSLDIHVQLLEEDLSRLSAPAHEGLSNRLKIIRGELQRLDGIVQQYLNLAGPSPANLQPVDVAAIVRHVCELLRPEAAARGVAIESEIASPLPTVQADMVQLTQALVNLVINAVQAVDRNGKVSVRAGADGSSVLFEVTDSGKGVPAERRSAVFEPFFTTQAEGSGMGLWIVQQIATAHGGMVGVSDAPGGGAAFILRIPAPEGGKPQ